MACFISGWRPSTPAAPTSVAPLLALLPRGAIATAAAPHKVGRGNNVFRRSRECQNDQRRLFPRLHYRSASARAPSKPNATSSKRRGELLAHLREFGHFSAKRHYSVRTRCARVHSSDISIGEGKKNGSRRHATSRQNTRSLDVWRVLRWEEHRNGPW